MDSMKILVLSYLFPNSLYPDIGIFVLRRIKAIQQYCDIKVINPIPWFPGMSKINRYKNFHYIPTYEKIEGLDVYHPRYFSIPYFFKILDALTCTAIVYPLALRLKQTFPFQLIDLHWTYPDILAGRLLARKLHLPQLVTFRGKEALYPGEMTFRSLLLKKLLPQSDFVIGLSEELRELALALGVHSENSRVVRNGVLTDVFYYVDQDSCRTELGLPSDEFILLTVGSLIYRKGIDRLIKALPRVLAQIPNAVLYIIGSEGPEGDYRKALHNLIAQTGVQSHVRFVGQIENRSLPQWYNACDVFCLVSRGEGSPNVLAEALACGCPSVATDVGSASEILAYDFMGRLVANNDEAVPTGLLQVLSQNFDRTKIAETMQQYDWDWCARQVVDIYRSKLKDTLT